MLFGVQALVRVYLDLFYGADDGLLLMASRFSQTPPTTDTKAST
jgi:hypothetical protein